MQKLKMVLLAGFLVTTTVFSVASLGFSDDAEPLPDDTGDAVMSNISGMAPDGLEPYSIPPAY